MSIKYLFLGHIDLAVSPLRGVGCSVGSVLFQHCLQAPLRPLTVHALPLDRHSLF